MPSLESVREFAAECLGEKAPALRHRHADWMLTTESTSVLETLSERENCEAALEFLEEENPQDALRLVAKIVRRWQQAGLLEAGIAAVERILTHFPGDPPSPEMGLTLSGLAALHFYHGEIGLARRCFERRLRVAEALGDRASVGEAQRNLGTIAVARASSPLSRRRPARV